MAFVLIHIFYEIVYVFVCVCVCSYEQTSSQMPVNLQTVACRYRKGFDAIDIGGPRS